MSNDEKVQITSVKMSNVKATKYVEIKPKLGTTVIGGKNGSGKTTLCEAVGLAIGGKKLMPKAPLRKGQDFGFVEVGLSECKKAGLMTPCKARVEFTRRKDDGIDRELTLTNEDGDPSGEPQTILNGLIGCVGFDPLLFLKASPKEQLEIVREVVKIDFTQLDAQRQRLYDQRTKVNAKSEEAKTRCGAILITGNAPDVEVSVSSLMKDLEAAQKVNQVIERKKNEHKVLTNSVGEIERQITEVTTKIEKLIAERTKLLQNKENQESKVIESLTALEALIPADTESISKQITDSEKVNQQVRKKIEKDKLNKEYEAQHELSKKLTADIEQIDETKKKMVAEAKWPIVGMSFSEEFGLAYNDVPLNQLCQSEGIRVSVAIGASLNPTLPYMFIKDGSLLDDQYKLEVATVAAEHGCQLFMELVGESDSCNVIMRDGEVFSVDEECVLPAEVEPVGSQEKTLF